jgi:hypothetical protein
MYTDQSPPQEEPILIMDSATDICCIGKGFKILFYTGEITSLGAAFSTTEPRTLHVVTAAAVITDSHLSSPIIILINQAAHIPDDNQYDSLLHTDQAHNHNVIVNDIACCYIDSHGHPG